MAGWNPLPIEAQERIIGRTKLSDIELDDTVKPSWAYRSRRGAGPGDNVVIPVERQARRPTAAAQRVKWQDIGSA